MAHRPSVFWYTWLSHPLEEKSCLNDMLTTATNLAHLVVTFSKPEARSPKPVCHLP